MGAKKKRAAHLANSLRILQKPLPLLTIRKCQLLILAIVRQKSFVQSPKKVVPIYLRGIYKYTNIEILTKTNYASGRAA